MGGAADGPGDVLSLLSFYGEYGGQIVGELEYDQCVMDVCLWDPSLQNPPHPA